MIRLVFYFAIIAVCFSCQKKKETIVVKQYEYATEGYTYGEFHVDFQFNPSSPFDLSSYYCYASFSKYPNNELMADPQIRYFTHNTIPLVKSNFSSEYSLPFQADLPNGYFYAFSHIDFSFYSEQLGGANQISETDEIGPGFTKSFTDTLYISKSTVNTFTVSMASSDYTGRIVLTNPLSEGSAKNLLTGNSQISFYPSEITDLTLGTSGSINFEFTKRKKIKSKGRNYYLNARIIYTYPVKVNN